MQYSHIYKALIVLISILFMGCSVGRNYQRPDMALPEQYGAATAADSSVAVRPWKEFFTDPVLQELIGQVLKNNFDLQLAIKRVEASHAYAKQAKAAWLPALNAQANASTSFPSENSLNGISLESFLGTNHVEDYTLSAELSWELDIWGKIRRRKEAALADYLQTFEAGRTVQTQLVAATADSYYNLLMMDEQLAIAERNVHLGDSIVQMMRLQKTAGEVTELAVQQAVAQYQNTVILVPQLEQAIALQENALRLLLGDWPGTIARQQTLDDQPVESELATGVPAGLLRYRPDVRASEQALIAANARVGVAKGNMYPALNITASGGLNAFEASNWFQTPASLFGLAAGSIMQPVFQRRALKTQHEVAKIEREQSVITFRQSVTTAVHEVTNALVKLDKLSDQQQIATERVETLERAVQDAQLLFRSGMANYLEVITAQNSALQAELDKAVITRQQLGAQVELYRSLGGGWN